MFAVVSIGEEQFVKVSPDFDSAVQWACQYIRDNYEETYADLEAMNLQGEDLVDEFNCSLSPLDHFFILECRKDEPASV